MPDNNSNLVKMSALLSDAQYHDDAFLGNQLGITPTAVREEINKLAAYGIEIEFLKEKGYLLKKPLVLLEKNKIRKYLKDKSIHIDIFEKIESTNDYLKNTLNDKKIKVCMAEMQTQGRGQLGKIWHSPFGQNIYCSIQYSLEKHISELSGLSLIVALAVTNAIESLLLIKNIKIKWPNDIFIENKKIAGILVDLQMESNGFCQVIIGIGINVNMENADINQAWNSLGNIIGRYIDRNELCAILIDTLLRYLSNFCKTGLSDFLSEWNQQDYLLEKSITLTSRSNQFSGIAAGINAQGHLLLTLQDKTIQAFSSGDASILK